jgi:hypothetical protein
MGIDEGHYPVNDACYVNAIASLALTHAVDAAKVLVAITGLHPINFTKHNYYRFSISIMMISIAGRSSHQDFECHSTKR